MNNTTDTIYTKLRGQHNVQIDIANAKKHEIWAKNYLISDLSAKSAAMVDSNDKKNRKYGDINIVDADNKKKLVEVKFDAESINTGRVFIEVEAYRKLSGISITKSHIWFHIYMCDDGKIKTGVAKVNKLKKLVNSGKYKIVGPMFARGVVIPTKDYEAICFNTHEVDDLEYINQIGLTKLYEELKKNDNKQNTGW